MSYKDGNVVEVWLSRTSFGVVLDDGDLGALCVSWRSLFIRVGWRQREWTWSLARVKR